VRGQNTDFEESAREVKVLLVEDNELNQLIASRIISQLGHEVDIANDGLEALNKCRNCDYSMIFMDIQMPVMNGLDASIRIRHLGLDHVTKTPIIAMTASSVPDEIEECFNAGMNAHIIKPVSYQDIENTLTRYGVCRKEVQSKGDIVTPVIDEEYNLICHSTVISLVKLFSSKAGYLEELLRDYLGNTTAFLGKLEAFVEGQSRDELIFDSHYLKGASNAIGAEQVACIVESIEEDLKNRSFKSFRPGIEKLKGSIEQTATVLRHEFSIWPDKITNY